jgi:Amt family ammonium transporter
MYIPSPPYINAGDNAWQLTAGTLVGLMSLPGLAVLYGGVVKRKWAVSSAVMCFYAFAAVLVVWPKQASKSASAIPGLAPWSASRTPS